MLERNCDWCDKSYTYKRVHSHYCSDNCRQAATRAEKKNGDPTAKHLNTAVTAVRELLKADTADIAHHASDYDQLIRLSDELYKKVGAASRLSRMT